MRFEGIRGLDMIRTYSELTNIPEYQDRLDYLYLGQTIGDKTFGGMRELNQSFYKSPLWRSIRATVIVRDLGLDLGHPDYPICDTIFVHHMNPVSQETLIHNIDAATNPEYLICVSFDTHQYIHFGRKRRHTVVERFEDDMILWERL